MTILDSNRVTSSNLVRQAHANIYNLINNRTNVPDPNDSTGKRKFVYQKFPDLTNRNFAGFPMIIVSRTKPAKRLGTVSLTKSFIDFDFFIGIYSQQGSHDSLGNPTASEQIDKITDSVRSALDDTSNQKALLNYGMGNIAYDIDTDEDSDFDGKNKTIFISEFDLRFENNLTKTG